MSAGNPSYVKLFQLLDRDIIRRGLHEDERTRQIYQMALEAIWPEIEHLQKGLEAALECIHFLEAQQAMPDDGYLPLLRQARAALDGH